MAVGCLWLLEALQRDGEGSTSGQRGGADCAGGGIGDGRPAGAAASSFF